ncbi:hypothetical protein AK812_SmicGene9791 [Symbiodinium microadriaticum]|uniref:Uncharacterized protein n=1 Tax=Symbiodinium microadriaticum TaxID=2951 RepID=A0A1Q9EHG7_SYMMI|nr:hypothetical protein AK812_SmicGene9791 [Symbiodinium microadriaticum]
MPRAARWQDRKTEEDFVRGPSAPGRGERPAKLQSSPPKAFVGKMGGIRQLFEQRSQEIALSIPSGKADMTGRKDVCDYIGIAEGARVRAHYFVQGQKSHGWREAQAAWKVLKVGVHMHFGKADMGPGTFGVLLQFGFGTDTTRKWTARQAFWPEVVPPAWILSGVEADRPKFLIDVFVFPSRLSLEEEKLFEVLGHLPTLAPASRAREDASVASALRESGILDEQQEMQAIAGLESCQRKALYTVRGYFMMAGGDEMLGTVLDWIQDLAPVVVHLHLDRVGAFMEIDEYYRNQFETKTSCGARASEQALDPENRTRQNWERDTELFGGAYDDAKPFDRCKYGVMNDYRGVVSARQYGDSYLVLKDVRLRCTFASTDSGGGLCL